jgi:hypothetical protein
VPSQIWHSVNSSARRPHPVRVRAGDRPELRSAGCQHFCRNTANALILGTLFPAHDDHNPSLHVSDNRGKPLVKCHAGCSQEVVINALRARGLWAKKTGQRKELKMLPACSNWSTFHALRFCQPITSSLRAMSHVRTSFSPADSLSTFPQSVDQVRASTPRRH